MRGRVALHGNRHKPRAENRGTQFKKTRGEVHENAATSSACLQRAENVAEYCSQEGIRHQTTVTRRKIETDWVKRKPAERAGFRVAAGCSGGEGKLVTALECNQFPREFNQGA